MKIDKATSSRIGTLSKELRLLMREAIIPMEDWPELYAKDHRELGKLTYEISQYGLLLP